MLAPQTTRIRAIDWVRGLVMMLMTVDHSGATFDAAHMHGDTAAHWVVGSPLPPAEFLTRWITHLCAPTFVMLAGASLALSSEKRKGQPGATRFIVTRGLFILALDPLWMSLTFTHYRIFVFQVLFAIGGSMALMAFLRRLSTPVMLTAALVLQIGGELSSYVHPTNQPLQAIWALLFSSGLVGPHLYCAYPLLPWLSIMMLGWVLGRWLLVPRSHDARARALAMIGVGLLGVFGVVRGIDGYGNWGLHKDSLDFLQWLHVAKYPPSVAFTALELGIAFLLLAAFTLADARVSTTRVPRPLAMLGLFGSTAFFYYLLHAHLLEGAQTLFGFDRNHDGLAKTWIAAGIVILVLLWPCALYRRYKAAHPDGLARYV